VRWIKGLALSWYRGARYVIFKEETDETTDADVFLFLWSLPYFMYLLWAVYVLATREYENW